MDHILYKAGLSLGLPISSSNRLGLKKSTGDLNFPKTDEVITQKFIEKLRNLLKEYGTQSLNITSTTHTDTKPASKKDEALDAFNKIMMMETNSLIDDELLSSIHSDLSLRKPIKPCEMYKTRLVRVDLGTRARTDPFQRWLHKSLRRFRLRKLLRKSQDIEDPVKVRMKHHYDHYQPWLYPDTLLIAEITGRLLTAAFTAVFLIAPLVVLSHESSKNIQLAIIAAWILGLSFLVSLFLKVTSFEMMAVAAAYAAILSVFVSNVPTDTKTVVN